MDTVCVALYHGIESFAGASCGAVSCLAHGPRRTGRAAGRLRERKCGFVESIHIGVNRTTIGSAMVKRRKNGPLFTQLLFSIRLYDDDSTVTRKAGDEATVLFRIRAHSARRLAEFSLHS